MKRQVNVLHITERGVWKRNFNLCCVCIFPCSFQRSVLRLSNQNPKLLNQKLPNPELLNQKLPNPKLLLLFHLPVARGLWHHSQIRNPPLKCQHFSNSLQMQLGLKICILMKRWPVPNTHICWSSLYTMIMLIQVHILMKYFCAQCIPGSLSAEDFSLELLGSLTTCSAEAEIKILTALQALYDQGLLENTDRLYQGLLDLMTKCVRPDMVRYEQSQNCCRELKIKWVFTVLPLCLLVTHGKICTCCYVEPAYVP